MKNVMVCVNTKDANVHNLVASSSLEKCSICEDNVWQSAGSKELFEGKIKSGEDMLLICNRCIDKRNPNWRNWKRQPLTVKQEMEYKYERINLQ